jgi:hypothetical protein
VPRAAANEQLQRTVRDKVPSHRRQRAAAEPERYPTEESMSGTRRQFLHGAASIVRCAIAARPAEGQRGVSRLILLGTGGVAWLAQPA